MRHLRSLEDISLGKTWLTIGVFDGVHRGHQKILKALTTGSKADDALSVVLSFYPHPAAILGKQKNFKCLTMPDEKAVLLANYGVDVLITHPFDATFASLSPEAFMAKLQKHLHLEKLLIGYDFALGKNRQGDATYLRVLGMKEGYVVERFEPYLDADGVISSTRVRDSLAVGNVVAANELIGHPYSLSGNVVRGDGRGRKINIPTANIEVSVEKAIPANGVYACYAYVDGVKHPAVTNVGVRPTFTPDQVEANIEAHLLDFDRDLYGQNLHLEFIERLRPEKKFNGVDELISQIHVDIMKAREILR